MSTGKKIRTYIPMDEIKKNMIEKIIIVVRTLNESLHVFNLSQYYFFITNKKEKIKRRLRYRMVPCCMVLKS